MKVLILSSLKVLLRWSEEEISKALNGGTPIIAVGKLSDSEKEKLKSAIGSYYSSLTEYDNYTRSSLILIQLYELAKKENITHIVAMSEMDVLRAAVLRKELGLEGMQPESAIYFRDKHLMKQVARKKGIKVADFYQVYNSLDLLKACEEFGYPVVVKPPMGRGSSGVQVLKSQKELFDFLEGFEWNDLGHQLPLLVEAYVEGNMYRVDGVVFQGKLSFISTALYWGSHLNYLGGGHLGSIILDPSSNQAKELVALTERILLDVLPFSKNGGFHVEIFQNSSGEYVFSEAASRLGGGSIIEEIEASFGLNIKTLLLAAETDSKEAVDKIKSNVNYTFTPAAQLHISPKPKVLAKAPKFCDRPNVYLYELMGEEGNNYQLMSHTNTEIARFVLQGLTPDKLEKELQETITWFKEETIWK